MLVEAIHKWNQRPLLVQIITTHELPQSEEWVTHCEERTEENAATGTPMVT